MSKQTKTKKPKSPTYKIAILSDVHGNLPALQAVMADAQKHDVTLFWNLGDFVGYGPFVNEVVDLLFETCSAQVIGNYDLRTLKFPKKQKKWRKTKKHEKYLAFQWAWERLSKKNAKRLEKLPQQSLQNVNGLCCLLTHGGPAAIDEAVGPAAPEKRLRELASMTEAAVILCGHTHEPFLRTLGHTTFINPGSVGRPEGGDPRASYALIDVFSDRFQVNFQKVNYDIERLSRAIHAAGLPEDFSKMFECGKSLDQIQMCPSQSVDIKRYDAKTIIAQARTLGSHYDHELRHSEQVTRLSILLFEKLQAVHLYSPHELLLLTCSAMLHDIGWTQGQNAHHKATMEMICSDQTLSVSENDRKKIAAIARYHRKALPKSTHAIYRDLTTEEQKQVSLLAGILRVADGLDRSHMSLVKNVAIKISCSTIEFFCETAGPASSEMAAARKKADLFEKCTGYKTRFSISTTTS